MGKSKAIIIGVGTTAVVAGTLVLTQLNKWFPDEPTGPGSGDEITVDQTETGDNLDRGNGPGLPGPGSGEELQPGETQTGDNLDRGNGPGLPGPGSGEELQPGETETGDNLDRGNGPGLPGPGSGEELPAPAATTDASDNNPQSGPGSGDEAKAYSSCNVIGSGSTCLDYTGTYWETTEYARSNCSRPEAWSTSPCPQPNMGGCILNGGTEMEMIVWHYNYGGDPFDAETAGYAAMACNASGGQAWIN